MAISQKRSRRKSSGSRYVAFRKKRKFELGRLPSHTLIGKTKNKAVRTRGNQRKQRLLAAETANVYDPKSKKFTQSKIITVSGSPSNVHFVRRNIMTKGSILTTEARKARITSRPGQDGTINAILI